MFSSTSRTSLLLGAAYPPASFISIRVHLSFWANKFLPNSKSAIRPPLTSATTNQAAYSTSSYHSFAYGQKRVSHEINRSGWENRFVSKTRVTLDEYTLSPGRVGDPTLMFQIRQYTTALLDTIWVNKRLHPAQPPLTPSMLYVVSMRIRSETSL